MHSYLIETTVDITPTGVTDNSRKDDPDFHLKRNQQRNYDTLMQVLSLRSNVIDPGVSIWYDAQTEANIWRLSFYTDHAGVFGIDNSAFIDDVHMVPVVPGLTETTPIFPPFFISKGEMTNIAIQNI
jgi:hypothetical protein